MKNLKVFGKKYALVIELLCLKEYRKSRNISWQCKWKLRIYIFFYFVDLHLSKILDNDQRDAHLLYFTVYLLHSSTCFEYYMLIIRRLNCIDAASGIVTLSGRPVPPDGHWLRVTIPDAASIQFDLLIMSI